MEAEINAKDVLGDRTVLITGGTGSFGRHFARRALAAGARAVRIYSRDEFKQSEMSQAMADDRLRFLIGDVRDLERLHRALAGADIVVHAAALKQVPACEYNPFEAVKTNVLGTQNVASACIDTGVSRAIALSTDKAVNPANLYGATKLCAEKLFVHSNAYVGPGATRFACVRYGNVVGSRGSVVPMFRAQARAGELTITHQNMTRFWISLDQSVDLVVLALTRMSAGEVFVPKVPSMRVVDLAQVLAPDVPVRFTGVRPGEKMHEILITNDEARHTVEYDTHFVIFPEHPHWPLTIPPGGTPTPEDFSYTSDKNHAWLDSSSLVGLIPNDEPQFAVH